MIHPQDADAVTFRLPMSERPTKTRHLLREGGVMVVDVINSTAGGKGKGGGGFLGQSFTYLLPQDYERRPHGQPEWLPEQGAEDPTYDGGCLLITHRREWRGAIIHEYPYKPL